MNSIDPKDIKPGTPHWCVFGPSSFPKIICFTLHFWETNDSKYKHLEGYNIWGYSVYRKKPGFRTIGKNFNDWIREQQLNGDMPVFFGNIDHATEYLKSILTPPYGCR